MNSLKQMAAEALARNADQPVIEFEDRWYGWGELRHVADEVARLIERSDADGSAAVSFIPRSHPSAIAALLGLIADGRTIRMIYAFQSPAAIARNVDRLQSALVVAAAQDFSEDVRRVMQEHGMAGIALDGMEATAVSGFERAHSERAIPATGEPQIEILTSGTTGPPKQFPVTHAMLARHHVAPRLAPGREREIAEEPPFLLSFPIGNISGIYTTLPTLLRGQRASLMERFSLEKWHEHLLRHRPVMGGLPPSAIQMALDAGISREDMASMRFLSTGAAPLDPTVHRAFEAHYGIPILLSYGATEFGGPVCGMTAELYPEWGEKKFGSVGRALPGAQLRVIDPVTEEVLPPGEQGILEVVSPRLEPKWIRTADIAVIDEDGFLFIRGRADGAIMRGGFKLLPETIERALLLHPAISAAGVVGIADRRLGQVPGAAVQIKPGVAAPTVAELETHLRQHVLATHIPTAWRFVEEMPKNASFKIDKLAIGRLFEEEGEKGE